MVSNYQKDKVSNYQKVQEEIKKGLREAGFSLDSSAKNKNSKQATSRKPIVLTKETIISKDHITPPVKVKARNLRGELITL